MRGRECEGVNALAGRRSETPPAQGAEDKAQGAKESDKSVLRPLDAQRFRALSSEGVYALVFYSQRPGISTAGLLHAGISLSRRE